MCNIFEFGSGYMGIQVFHFTQNSFFVAFGHIICEYDSDLLGFRPHILVLESV